MSNQNVVFIDNSNNVFHHDKVLELNKVSYLHPKGQPIVYILLGEDICELQVVEPNVHGSWFINQRISSDGKFYLVSRIDPRFLCLPYLEKSGSKYCPLDQIITRTEGCDRIPIEKATTWNMNDMCDVNDKYGDDMILYRYNEEKTVEWLKYKINKTSQVLANQKHQKSLLENYSKVDSFNSSGQSSSSSIIEEKKDNIIKIDKDDILSSVQIISDYLTTKMSIIIAKEFGFSEEELYLRVQTLKRKADWEAELEIEKESIVPLTHRPSAPAVSSTTKKKVVPNASSKIKPIVGQKGMMSFFGKK